MSRSQPRRAPVARSNRSTSPEHPVIVIAKAMRDAHRLASKATKLHNRLKGYGLPDPDATTELAKGLASVAQELRENLRKIPKTWKAARGSIGNAPVEPGDHIQLKPEALKRYAGLLTKDAIYVVLKIAGNKVVCKEEASGMVVPVSRSNVQRVDTASAS